MLTWLVDIIVKDIIGAGIAFIAKMFKMYEADKAAHQANVDQAAQDVQKAKEVKPDTPAKEVDGAIDDELKHF